MLRLIKDVKAKTPLFILGMGVLTALVLASCGESNSSSDVTAPMVTVAPVLTPNSNLAAPLAGTLTLTTDELTRVTLAVADTDHTWSVAYEGLATDHSLPVVRLHPGETHTINVTVTDAAGNSTPVETPLTITTDPLPADFPPFTQTVFARFSFVATRLYET